MASRNKQHVETFRTLLAVVDKNERFLSTMEREAVNAAIDELKDYNGWTNRETWAVALHIDNNQWSHEYRRELLQTIKRMDNNSGTLSDGRKIWTDEEFVRYRYAEALKDWVEELFTDYHEAIRQRDGPKSRTRDIMSMIQDVGSLWRVEWQEIADNFISDEE